MASISVQSLCKRFGDEAALSDVSLTVESGEMVALIGASGSGKSTLIRHIAGLLAGDADTPSRVLVDGCVIQEGGRLVGNAKGIRRRVGVVFQQYNLIGRLSVVANVLVGLLGRIPAWRGTIGLFNAEERHLALGALERVGIRHTAQRRAATLSGGQQQRAAIARALVQCADVILADEPIASLDPASARRIMEILRRINTDDGITVLVSLHQVEYARRYCPRTIALSGGKVAYDGPSSALTNAFLKDLYGDAAEELVLPDAPVTDTAPVPAGAALANA